MISGAITLLTFIANGFIVERVVGNVLFSGAVENWYERLAVPRWSIVNYALNIFTALVNCMLIGCF